MSKDKVSLTAGQISDKWNRRMKGAVSDIQAGIDSVTESPTAKAAQKADKMLQNMTKAVQSGKWANSLNAVTLQDWKQKTKDKVAQRLASGVDGSMAKRQKFDAYLVNTVNSALQTIKGMPDMTLEDSVNRVRAMMTHMANNPYKQ
ncbi:MAG: hypothetical protein PHI02_09335 [Sulfurovaceae bacterium]|nr:hypothetical protein [Sulfurovaceae bacterium]